MKKFHSFSSEETKAFGNKIAQGISNFQFPISKKQGALVLALHGDLGAGKTTFTQGFFAGLGIKKRAISPTFVLFRRYAIRHKLFANLYHFDAYRLKKAEDMAVLEFDKTLSDPQNIVLIEWPERVRKALPKNTIWLQFQHGRKENERKIIIKG
jgi:tRNA threonylcarbamoyladenosine biosynthesis protein TsaE